MKMITAIYSYILYSIFHIYDKVIQWKHTEVCAGHQPSVGDINKRKHTEVCVGHQPSVGDRKRRMYEQQ